jgi:hypothetical protein
MSIKRTTVYYEKTGKEHTEETHRIALEGAKARSIETVVVASTTGDTALKAMEAFKGSGLNLVVVTHQTGWRAPGLQLFPEETRKILEEEGVKVVTCSDAFSGGVGKGIARQRPEKKELLQGRLPFIVPPVAGIIDSTLHLFCNGMKVCVEISMMAADTGTVPVDRPIVAVAGTHVGSDTAIVITPSTSNRIKELMIHEILAKPLSRERK